MSKLKNEGLRERLAALEYDRWVRWQRFLHTQCIRNDDGSLTIPADKVQSWERQTAIAYAQLSEYAKDVGREEADNTLAVLAGYFADLATAKS